MLDHVPVMHLSPHRFDGVVPEALMRDLAVRAGEFQGTHVLHLTATPDACAADQVRAVVGLSCSLGIVADWRVLAPAGSNRPAARAVREALLGHGGPLASEACAAWLGDSAGDARRFGEEYDFVVVHDPEPAALLALRGPGRSRWLWSTGLDLSRPDPAAWALFRPLLREYAALCFATRGYSAPTLESRVTRLPSCIDESAPRNLPLPADVAEAVMRGVGIDPGRPLFASVGGNGRVGHAALDALRATRRRLPGLQLAIVAPEIDAALHAACAEEPSVHLFTSPGTLGAVELGALRRLALLVVHGGGDEDFGIGVAEALWAGTPVFDVALTASALVEEGPSAPATRQGNLVEAVEAAVRDPHATRARGEAGRRRVAAQYLAPRRLADELALMACIADPLRVRPRLDATTDPVCGMTVTPDAAAITSFAGGRRFLFCSQACRLRFEADPELFLGSAAVRA